MLWLSNPYFARYVINEKLCSNQGLASPVESLKVRTCPSVIPEVFYIIPDGWFGENQWLWPGAKWKSRCSHRACSEDALWMLPERIGFYFFLWQFFVVDEMVISLSLIHVRCRCSRTAGLCVVIWFSKWPKPQTGELLTDNQVDAGDRGLEKWRDVIFRLGDDGRPRKIHLHIW